MLRLSGPLFGQRRSPRESSELHQDTLANSRDQRLHAADQHAAGGRLSEALHDYSQLLAETPADVRVLLRVGDVQARAGDFGAAVATYQEVAELYIAQADPEKAAAVYRQVWELARSHPEAAGAAHNYEAAIDELVRLFRQEGQLDAALALLDEEAVQLREADREEAAIALFRKMTKVAANIPLSHLRLAEGLCRLNHVDEAMGSFGSAAELLQVAGRFDDALRVIERMLHFKQDPKVAKRAAELYLRKGGDAEGMQALSRLQICFQADGRDLETLQLLARAFEVIGQHDKSVEVKKELARQAHEQGHVELFHATLSVLRNHAPEDEQIQALSELPPPGSSPVATSESTSHAAGQARSESAVREEALPESVELHSVVPAAAAVEESSSPRQQDGLEPLAAAAPSVNPSAELLSEPTQEIPSERIATMAPPTARRGPPPLPPNAFAANEAGPAPSAIALSSDSEAALLAASNVGVTATDESSAAQQADAAESTSVTSSPPPKPGSRAGRVSSGPPLNVPRTQPAAVDEAIELDEYDEELELIEAESEDADLALLAEPGDVDSTAQRVADLTRSALADARTFAGLKLYDKAIERLQSALEFDPRSIEVRELLRDIYAETGDREGAIEEMLTTAAIYLEYDHPEHARTVLLDVLAAEPDHALAKRTLAQLGGTAPTAPPRLPQFEEPEPDENDSARRLADERRSVEETLEQVEILLASSRNVEARDLLEEQLKRHPSHPLLLEAAGELDAREDQDDFDLRASLDALEQAVRESQQPPPPGSDKPPSKVNVERVFEKFKAKVKSQVAENDSGTHHDLGVAYKEMGLLPDAVTEFSLAARDPKRACACYSMIGHIQAEMGDWHAAAESFGQGLSVVEQTPAQSLSLNYDLGIAYDELGDAPRAREQFELVVDADPNYRDARQRLDALGGPSSGHNVGDDELDRAFEELLGSD